MNPPAPFSWHPVVQELATPALADPLGELRARLAAASPPLPGGPRPRIAVAVGSRGIAGIADVVAAVVAHLRARGADPFLVPAMGTHGGGTAPEQEAVLAHLGITEETVGAPVISQPEVQRVGTTPGGVPVWVDRAAWAADGIVPVNRVKPHTAFAGAVESGPSKLLAVGLGKAESAAALHRAPLERAIPEVAELLLGTGRVPFGVALAENAAGATAALDVLLPPGWLAAEAALLARARRLAPRLPWDDLDLLVVQELGKDVSGTGLDLHVIGLDRRFPGRGAVPRIRRIAALGLTPGSRGNANGVGYADVVTRALADAVDWPATYANCRATGFLEAVRLPYVAADEAEAVAVALRSLRPDPGPAVRAVRIRDTSRLLDLEVSPALWAALPEGVHKRCG